MTKRGVTLVVSKFLIVLSSFLVYGASVSRSLSEITPTSSTLDADIYDIVNIAGLAVGKVLASHKSGEGKIIVLVTLQ